MPLKPMHINKSFASYRQKTNIVGLLKEKIQTVFDPSFFCHVPVKDFRSRKKSDLRVLVNHLSDDCLNDFLQGGEG